MWEEAAWKIVDHLISHMAALLLQTDIVWMPTYLSYTIKVSKLREQNTRKYVLSSL